VCFAGTRFGCTGTRADSLVDKIADTSAPFVTPDGEPNVNHIGVQARVGFAVIILQLTVVRRLVGRPEIVVEDERHHRGLKLSRASVDESVVESREGGGIRSPRELRW